MKAHSVSRMMLVLILAVALIPLGCSSTPAQIYATPDQAADSLIQALRAHNREQLIQILGSDADELVASGDEVEDRNATERFLEMYDAKHRLAPDEDGRMTLIVGDTDWPMPIPLVKNDKGEWQFDTDAGKDEIISRRVGRNELSTIQVCLTIVDAQREYVFEDRDGNSTRDYAQKFLSDAGKKNGLYWETGPNEKPSPLGALVAGARAEGYESENKPNAYHGYHFKILKAQGEHAKGGAMDYVVGGKMIGGFAVIAFPAEYGNSGVMTFIVNHEGVVYQRDLGSNTSNKAASIKSFDPDSQWQKVGLVDVESP